MRGTCSLLSSRWRTAISVQTSWKHVSRVYSTTGPRSLPALRWELFWSNTFEDEMFPPAGAALLPSIMKTNYISKPEKPYHMNSLLYLLLKKMAGRWKVVCAELWYVLLYQLHVRPLNSPSAKINLAVWLYVVAPSMACLSHPCANAVAVNVSIRRVHHSPGQQMINNRKHSGQRHRVLGKFIIMIVNQELCWVNELILAH